MAHLALVIWDDLVSKWREEWRPASLAKFLSVLVAGAVIAWEASTGERWVPLLDGANLAFHEAGHLIYGVFGATLALYGGTLGQLTFPVVCLAIFWVRREATSFSVCAIWLAQNLCNIARYVADARAQELPLVGGGEHDWNDILSRWGALQSDLRLGATLHGIGIVGMLTAGAWLGLRWYRGRPLPQVNGPASLGPPR
jgi:hypothetical protein